MSLLTYNALREFVDNGHLRNVEERHINPASIDVRLADDFMIENASRPGIVDLSEKRAPNMVRAHSDEGTITLHPGEVMLASTIEYFDMPNDVAGLFVLKSTPSRAFLTNMHSGWIDPGFNGSPLTMQLKNTLQYSCLRLKAGMPIGQIVFWRGEDVPAELSYAARGSYNQRDGVGLPQ